ncbi:hypothetical protein AN641_08180 [Candidatus Epulonipiscioides gigas]|nr:hypothetical protein AN641_08180 [Epulopiscium sp. SCG-C07WGA-EpuloA2]
MKKNTFILLAISMSFGVGCTNSEEVVTTSPVEVKEEVEIVESDKDITESEITEKSEHRALNGLVITVATYTDKVEPEVKRSTQEEALSEQLTRDINNDGLNDVYAMAFSHTNFFLMAVLSNGGSYVGRDENGIYFNNTTSVETMEALVWADEYAKKDYELFPEKWTAQP